MPSAKRAVLIGIDGGDPLMVRRFVSEGKMPHLKKLLSAGASVPRMLGAHPTITPTNWASIATGAWPGTHGLTDFWVHTAGEPLDKLHSGFDARQSRAEFIWEALARAGKKSIVLNYPTSWPPANADVVMVDGSSTTVFRRTAIDNERWHRASTDQAQPAQRYRSMPVDVNVEFQIAQEGHQLKSKDTADTAAVAITIPVDWASLPSSALPPKELILPFMRGEVVRPALLLSEGGAAYDAVAIFAERDARSELGRVRGGQWSEWVTDAFPGWTQVAYRFFLRSLHPEGLAADLYACHVLNLQDHNWVQPRTLYGDLLAELGPVCCYSGTLDDYICFDVQQMLHQWYGRAVQYLARSDDWSLLYMHCHAIDFANHRYMDQLMPGKSERAQALGWLSRYYQMVDEMVGKILAVADDETLVLVVSDHGGMTRRYADPGLGDPHTIGGRLLEQHGYLHLTTRNGEVQIDWPRTRAVCQRSCFIYINRKGRDPHGAVEPADYESLVQEIIDLLLTYRDPESGERPIALALRTDDMPVLGLYGDRVGDIYYAVRPGWARVHGNALTTATYTDTSVGCLFVMAGAGVRQGVTLDRPVRVVDIVPTICHALQVPVPRQAEGGVLYQAFV